jgi:hypothetical protein
MRHFVCSVVSCGLRHFYDLRSQLVHGQEIGQFSPANYVLFRRGEDVLRKVLARAILELSFATTFSDGTVIEGNCGK